MRLFLSSIEPVLIIQLLKFYTESGESLVCKTKHGTTVILRYCQVICVNVCVWDGYGKERTRAVNCRNSYLTSLRYKFWEQLRSLHMTRGSVPILDCCYLSLCFFSLCRMIHWALSPSCSLFVMSVICKCKFQ